jgi:ParB family chromosome partitioning protein
LSSGEESVSNEVRLDLISPNPFQPRVVFDEDKIQSLSESILQDGLLQPLVVRKNGSRYELVAGERRFRASLLAGIEKVPVLVKSLNDQKMLELALVENVQRADLNAIEKAKAFYRLVSEYGWTQETVAKSVGLSRPSVANFLRLLELLQEIQDVVSRGTITMGHARALLSVESVALQRKLLAQVIKEDLSVRVLEGLIGANKVSKGVNLAGTDKDPYLVDLEEKLTDFFGTRVRLESKKRGGKIVVEWYSDEQFSGILTRLGLSSH